MSNQSLEPHHDPLQLNPPVWFQALHQRLALQDPPRAARLVSQYRTAIGVYLEGSKKTSGRETRTDPVVPSPTLALETRTDPVVRPHPRTDPVVRHTLGDHDKRKHSEKKCGSMDGQSFVIYGPTLLKQPVTAVCSELSVVVCITHAIFARAVQLCSFCTVAALPCIRDLRAVSSERADSSSGADSNESLALGFLFAFALAFLLQFFASIPSSPLFSPSASPLPSPSPSSSPSSLPSP